MGLRGTLIEIRAQTPPGNHRSAKKGIKASSFAHSSPAMQA
jgi:hypothetical protein